MERVIFDFTVLSPCWAYIRQSNCSLFGCCQNQEKLNFDKQFWFLPLNTYCKQNPPKLSEHIYNLFENNIGLLSFIITINSHYQHNKFLHNRTPTSTWGVSHSRWDSSSQFVQKSKDPPPGWIRMLDALPRGRSDKSDLLSPPDQRSARKILTQIPHP